MWGLVLASWFLSDAVSECTTVVHTDKLLSWKVTAEAMVCNCAE